MCAVLMLKCPECGEVVPVTKTHVEEYGDLKMRSCPQCENESEMCKWQTADGPADNG